MFNPLNKESLLPFHNKTSFKPNKLAIKLLQFKPLLNMLHNNQQFNIQLNKSIHNQLQPDHIELSNKEPFKDIQPQDIHKEFKELMLFHKEQP